ncbi:hypothetical protein F5Y15DRAFT_413578 [Xylariaceae sp. FL0016]|nr:hypothetical protein F5Y15DRAFT_413578 [Xylariaceae sp. FL0016]
MPTMPTPSSSAPSLPNMSHPHLAALPDTPVVRAALALAHRHLETRVYNHVVRSAYWMLLLARKIGAGVEAGGTGTGTGTGTPSSSDDGELGSMGGDKGRRFEVEGADVARGFLGRHGGEGWDERRVQLVWDIIALHTTPFIAQYAAPGVALAHLGIMADFMGPMFPKKLLGRFLSGASPSAGADDSEHETGVPGQVITEAEYREVTSHFPLAGFGREGCKEILCGLCGERPGGTYDNFVGWFGVECGVDGKGTGKEEYKRKWEEENRKVSEKLLMGLDYLEELVGESQD